MSLLFSEIVSNWRDYLSGCTNSIRPSWALNTWCYFEQPLPTPEAMQRCPVMFLPVLTCTKKQPLNGPTKCQKWLPWQSIKSSWLLKNCEKGIKKSQFWLYPPQRQRVRWEAVSWLAPVSSCFLWPAGPDAAGSLSTQPRQHRQRRAQSAQLCWVFRVLTLNTPDSFVLFHRVCWRFWTSPRRSACCGKQTLRNSPQCNNFSCLPERTVSLFPLP